MHVLPRLHRSLAVLAAAALSSAFPLAAFADAASEVAAAANQASLAAVASTETLAKSHLQQLLNCLVGRGKKGFNRDTDNPCDGLGNGAIADTEDVLKREILQRAASKALEALQDNDLASIQRVAAQIQGSFKNIKY